MTKKNYQAMLLFLFCSALIIRMFALFVFEPLNHPQTWEYEEIANNLLAGRGLYFTNLGVPCRNTAMILYSLICAAIYYLSSHSFLALKLFQILLSVSTCFLIYRISQRLFGAGLSLVALALLAVHPGLVVYSVKLHPLTLDTFLFTTFIYLLIAVADRENVLRNSFLTGLCLAAASLTRATIGLFIPFTLLIVFLAAKKAVRYSRRAVIYVLAGILIVLAPLVIRNYLAFGRIVILPNDSGVNFWRGNNPYTNGTANTLDGRSVLSSAPTAFLEKAKQLDEFGQKRLFYQTAGNFIKNNPQKFLVLFVKKLYYFWWFTPTEGLGYPRLWFLLYKAYYSVALFFASLWFLLRLRVMPRQKQYLVAIVALFMLTISIAQALYYVGGRHRWAIEPFILIFTAGGIGLIWDSLRTDQLKIRR